MVQGTGKCEDVCGFSNSIVVYDGNWTISDTTLYEFSCPGSGGFIPDINSLPFYEAFCWANAFADMFREHIQIDPFKGKVVNLVVKYGQQRGHSEYNSKTRTALLACNMPRNTSTENSATGDNTTAATTNENECNLSIFSVGHELCHGFTVDYSTIGARDHAQAGGIVESISDLCGVMLEQYVFGNSTFKVGCDIKNGCLRNMCNQSEDGISIISNEDYRKEIINTHVLSGVYNRFICLLANKPTYDLTKVFRLFAFSTKDEWSGNLTFDMAACGLLCTAVRLEYDIEYILDAFMAIGVCCPPTSSHKCFQVTNSTTSAPSIL